MMITIVMIMNRIIHIHNSYSIGIDQYRHSLFCFIYVSFDNNLVRTFINVFDIVIFVDADDDDDDATYNGRVKLLRAYHRSDANHHSRHCHGQLVVGYRIDRIYR
jgi:hypothetical protein